MRIFNLILPIMMIFSSCDPVYAYDPKAEQIQTDTSNFDKNLSASDTTVQKALDTLDELVAGSGDSMTLAAPNQTVVQTPTLQNGFLLVDSNGVSWTVSVDTYGSLVTSQVAYNYLLLDSGGALLLDNGGKLIL